MLQDGQQKATGTCAAPMARSRPHDRLLARPYAQVAVETDCGALPVVHAGEIDRLFKRNQPA
jgi:hypothetical protein